MGDVSNGFAVVCGIGGFLSAVALYLLEGFVRGMVALEFSWCLN